jgi:hypothetical protein
MNFVPFFLVCFVHRGFKSCFKISFFGCIVLFSEFSITGSYLTDAKVARPVHIIVCYRFCNMCVYIYTIYGNHDVDAIFVGCI